MRVMPSDEMAETLSSLSNDLAILINPACWYNEDDLDPIDKAEIREKIEGELYGIIFGERHFSDN